MPITPKDGSNQILDLGDSGKIINVRDVPEDGKDAVNANYVQAEIAAAMGSVHYVITLDCSTNPDYPASTDIGDKIIVSVGGRIGGVAGKIVNAGDEVVSNTINAGGDEATVGIYWDLIPQINTVQSIANAILPVGTQGETLVLDALNQPTFTDHILDELIPNVTELKRTPGGVEVSRIYVEQGVKARMDYFASGTDFGFIEVNKDISKRINMYSQDGNGLTARIYCNQAISRNHLHHEMANTVAGANSTVFFDMNCDPAVENFELGVYNFVTGNKNVNRFDENGTWLCSSGSALTGNRLSVFNHAPASQQSIAAITAPEVLAYNTLSPNLGTHIQNLQNALEAYGFVVLV